MSRFIRREHARALRAPLLAAAMAGATACVALSDPDAYSPTRVSGGGAGGEGSSAGPASGAPSTADAPAASDPSNTEALPDPTLPAPTATESGGARDGGAGSTGGAPSSPVPSLDASAPPALADAAAPASCAQGESLGPNGHCYFIDAELATWDDARANCQARGAGWDLASVRSAAESEFLGDELEFEAWIGASDADIEGTWVWVVDDLPFWSGTGETGSAIDDAYVNWNATEPNGSTGTNCARALERTADAPDRDAPWADLVCTQTLGAICEGYLGP